MLVQSQERKDWTGREGRGEWGARVGQISQATVAAVVLELEIRLNQLLTIQGSKKSSQW
jgi:hypothetical protein